MRRIILISQAHHAGYEAGKIVSEWLGSHFVDYERELERAIGHPLSTARAALGPDLLREIEDNLIADLALRDDIVVSVTPGAGLEGIFFLVAPPAVVFLITQAEAECPFSHHHSTKKSETAFREAVRVRLRQWEGRAQLVTTNPSHPGFAAYNILSSLDHPAPRIIPNEVHPIILAPKGYPYFLSWLHSQLTPPPERVILVVSRSFPVDALRWIRSQHLRSGFARVCGVLRVSSSERARTSDSLSKLWRSVSRFHGFNKKDMIIGVGSQNAMHLASALAATIFGGVRLALVPTTLSAMLGCGAGYSGALRVRSSGLPLHFNYCSVVSLIDPLYVLLSGEDDIRRGYFEIVRIAMVGDAVLFDRIDQWSQEGRPFAHRFGELAWVLERALRVKIRLLEQDTLGTDRALVLRLGEPFFSAFLISSRSTYSGAEAGASALVLAIAVSRGLGVLSRDTEERLISLLKRLGLPTAVPDFIPFDDFFDALTLDPYVSAEDITLALSTGIGSVSLFQIRMSHFKPLLARAWSSLCPAART